MLDFLRIYKKNKELNNFYLSVFIRKLGVSLISIFMPIFLYQAGYSIILILLFYLIGFFCFALFSYTGGKIISHIGPKHAILLSTPFSVLTYVGLIYLDTFPILFYIIPIISTINTVLYYLSYHLIFVKESHTKSRGQETALVGILVIIAGIISPFVGGILAELNFIMLFSISAFLIAVSSVPLFFTKDIFEKISFTPKKLIRDIFKKENRGNFISFAGYGIERVIEISIWPIFIMLIVGNLEKTGLIISISTALSLVAYYVLGKLTDRTDKIKLLRIGSYFYSVGWILRIFASNMFGIITIDSYKGITQKAVMLPWSAHVYELTEKTDVFEFIILKEIIFSITRVVILLFLMVIFWINFYPFIISFVIAAIASLGYKYIHK